MSFYREREIKAVRKPRRCNGCGAQIGIGEAALDCAGHYDGDFWAAAYHPDCRHAEIALNNLRDVRHGDEWNNLGNDMEWEDWPWLIDEYPAVAARLRITAERYNEVRESQERCRIAFMKHAKALSEREKNHG